MTLMQRAVALIYPDQCAVCAALVDRHGALCADCWRETRFITGHACDTCGQPLPGESDGHADLCDDCLTIPRPWGQGRAAIVYSGVGRRLVLALKHGDRTDLAAPAGRWMARAGADVLTPGVLIVPVPAHWRRRIARRYNPAVELARAVAQETGSALLVDALTRHRATPPQKGLGVDARFANLDGAIRPAPRHRGALAARQVCLVDDTMTSGATLAAATEALLDAGAAEVSVLVLARVVKAH